MHSKFTLKSDITAEKTVSKIDFFRSIDLYDTIELISNGAFYLDHEDGNLKGVFYMEITYDQS